MTDPDPSIRRRTLACLFDRLLPIDLCKICMHSLFVRDKFPFPFVREHVVSSPFRQCKCSSSIMDVWKLLERMAHACMRGGSFHFSCEFYNEEQVERG